MMAMGPRERLLTAVTGGQADRTPVIIPGGMMSATLEPLVVRQGFSYPQIHTQPDVMARFTRRLQETCRLDNVGAPLCMTIEAEAFGAGVDLGSHRKEPRVTRYPAADLAGVIRLAATTTPRMRVALEAIARLAQGDTPVVGNLTGPVSLLTSLVDAMTVYRAMQKDPQSVRDALAHLSSAIIHFGRALLTAGADLILIADPSAAGDVLGRYYFQIFAEPYINHCITELKAMNAPVILHICGDLRPVIPLMADIPWDVLSIDAMVPLGKLCRRLGNRPVMGNVSTHLLAAGRPHQVARAASRCLEHVSVLAPACGLSPLTPLANIKTMAKAARTSPRQGEQTANPRTFNHCAGMGVNP